LLVGQLALRLGERIEWEASKMRVLGIPDAAPLIQPEFRKGWEAV
jgi:hypothetical protein